MLKALSPATARAIALAILVLALVATSVPCTVVAEGPQSCELTLLAVDENWRGTAVKVKLSVVKPGSGRVSNVGPVGEDTITSFKLALIYASIVTSVDYKCCDYLLETSERVEGLSATLAFYMFAVDLLAKNKCPENYTATGVIGPGGVVGSVSALREKLEAASDLGLRVYAQSYQVRNLASTTPLVEGVYTVYDAYEAMGQRLEGDLSALETYLKAYQRAFHGPYNELLRLVNETIERLNGVNWVDGYFNESLQSLRELRGFAERGEYYTASSIAFRALVYSYASWLNYTLSTGAFSEAVEELVSRARVGLSEVERAIAEIASKATYAGLEQLDAMSAAYARALEATSLLELIEQLPSSITVYATVLARANSALAWLNVSETLVSRGQVSLSTLEKSLVYVRDYWSVTRDYSAYMVSEPTLIGGFEPKRRSPVEEYLTTIAGASWLSRLMYSSDTGLRVFAYNATTRDVEHLISTSKRVLSWLYETWGFAPVEPILLVDLAQDYLELGEDPGEVIPLLYEALSKATVYALMARAISGSGVKGAVGREVALAAGAALTAAGLALVLASYKGVIYRCAKSKRVFRLLPRVTPIDSSIVGLTAFLKSSSRAFLSAGLYSAEAGW